MASLILAFFKDNRALGCLAVMASLVSGLSSAALIARISQQFVAPADTSATFFALLAVLAISAVGFNLAANAILVRLTNQFLYAFRLVLAHRIVSTSFERLEEVGEPRLLAAQTEDARVIGAALHTLPSLCIQSAIVTGCLTFLAWLSPAALAALVLVAIPVAVVYRYLHKRANKFAKDSLRIRDLRFGQFRSLVHGIKELQIYRNLQNHFFKQHLEKTGKAFRDSRVRVRMAFEYAAAWTQAAYFVYIIFLFALVAWDMVPPEIVAAYALIALYMRSAITRLVGLVPQWVQANVSWQKIEELELSAPADPSEGSIEISHSNPASEPVHLIVSEVTYQYAEGFSVGPLNFEVRAPQIVFFTGANGSGKTTLFKLLTGLYRPASGKIRLQGEEITDANLESFRQHFSVVYADFYLFDDLVTIDDEKLEQQAHGYLKKLLIDTDVSIDNGRLSTTKLSTGQRKRLALLAAYLADRPIFVFDEWAADQDPEFKQLFYHELLPELKKRGKLVLVISHDDRYFDAADRIIHLNEGQIQSKGK